MKRLVYAPQVNVWVKTDTGIVDLSSYVTDFSVHRRVNAVSSAEITFRNPKVEGPDGEPHFMFTQHPASNPGGTTSYGPMFHPMDPIVITLTRLKGYPVQVFTGYCDKSPYVQLYPGLAQMTASCTLKRLKHTYWDPGLPFVSDYLEALGWKPTQDGGLAFNPTAEQASTSGITDTSFAYLIYRILQDVGGWNHDDIYVQGLPAEAIQTIVAGIYAQLTGDAKANFKDVSDFLDKVIGSTTVGGAVGGGGGGGGGGGVLPAGQGGITTASFYGDGAGFAGGGTRTPDGVIPRSTANANSVNHGYWFAELSNDHAAPACFHYGQCDFAALGKLPYGTPVQVTYGNKSIIVRKADVGGGGDGLRGYPRTIDLWVTAWNALNIPSSSGIALVRYKVLTEEKVKELRRNNQVSQ